MLYSTMHNLGLINLNTKCSRWISTYCTLFLAITYTHYILFYFLFFNQLRSLAFSKPVSNAVIQSVHKQNHPLQKGETSKKNIPLPPSLASNTAIESVDYDVDPKSWQDWKNKDQMVCWPLRLKFLSRKTL